MPSERFNHASVMHDDGTMYVYGGFSQRCADYCDDIWFFDIYQKVSMYCIYVREAFLKLVLPILIAECFDCWHNVLLLIDGLLPLPS